MSQTMSEQDRAKLSRVRGMTAAEDTSLTPQQRRSYISRQGEAEAKERSSGVGEVDSDRNNPLRIRGETYANIRAKRQYERMRRSKSSR